MVDGLFCATLTGRTGGHTPFVQAGAERPAPVRRRLSRTQVRGCVYRWLELKCGVLWGAAPDGRVSAEWSRCPGSMAQRPRASVVPLGRISACCMTPSIGGTQASSHNSQGVVDGGVNKAGVSTATPDSSAVFCGWMDQGKGGYSQCCCYCTSTGASKPLQERDAWCQLLAR